MATEIVREFDPNIFLPEELKNTTTKEVTGAIDTDPDIDEQVDTLDDDNSDLDEDSGSDGVETPNDIIITSQQVRTDPSGRQVVDVVISFEDIPNATKYDIRVTKT